MKCLLLTRRSFCALACCASALLPSLLQADITLSWDPDSDPSVVGYRLYAGTTSGVYTQTNEAGAATSVLVANLTPGKTYYFAVTGYNSSAVESSFSNQISYTVPSSSPTPTPSPTATPSATPTPSPSATPSPTPTATATPSPTPVATPTPSPNASPSPTPTPAATPSHVQGSGSVNGPGGGEVSFNMNVQAQKFRGRTKVAGSFSCSDSTGVLSLSTAKINSLTFNGNQAQFTTGAKIGKARVSFTVTVTGNADTGTADTFSIQGSNGLSVSGNLVSGDITIN